MKNRCTHIAVFASGSGSNFQAIIDAFENEQTNIKVALLVCDNPSAFVIERAKQKQIETFIFNPKSYNNKESYEIAVKEMLSEYKVEWIFLAGYMRIIGKTLLQAYPNRIVNIHPALLPSFPGANGIKDAYESGVKVFGVTLHFVDEGVDTGKIIDQDSFKIKGSESLEEIENRIHQLEHILYPKVIKSLIIGS